MFPTGISPEGVWGGVCKKRFFTTSFEKPARKLLNNHEMLLALITASPGQSSATLAQQLGISVAAVRQLLRELESLAKVHYRPSAVNKRIRLYYAGPQPSHTTPKATASTRDLRVVNTEEPPLLVYFVDPLTLQEICKCPSR